MTDSAAEEARSSDKGDNGRPKRVTDLDAAGPEAVPLPEDISPDEARALIDDVFRGYGLDPEEVTDAYGWRYLSLGSAQGAVGVVEWEPGQYHLLVRSAMLNLPPDDAPLCDFYRLLLELNHDGTLSARFSVHDSVVGVSLSRPIRDLTRAEIHDAIRAVMVVADSYDEWLQESLDRVVQTAPLPLDHLPDFPMTPRDAEAISTVLGRCDAHGREVFRHLMERWSRTGYIVAPGTSGIGLAIPLGRELFTLASMRPGVGERRQLLILGWEGLRRRPAFPPGAVDRFQATVEQITDLQATETMAHIEITESFDRICARALLRALRALAREVRPELGLEEPAPEGLADEEPFQWDRSLPLMEVKLPPKTLVPMQETLLACEPYAQRVFADLIEGWHQAGGSVQCRRPGRVFLKFQSRERDSGDVGRRSQRFNLAVLNAHGDPRGPTVEVAWNLATGPLPYLDYAPEAVARFESVVAALPGFTQEGNTARLLVDEAFEPEHAHAFFGAMLALAAEAGWQG